MYQCEYCNYESFSKFNVKRHEAKRHKHKLNQDFQNPGKYIDHGNIKHLFKPRHKIKFHHFINSWIKNMRILRMILKVYSSRTRFLYKKTNISKTI